MCCGVSFPSVILPMAWDDVLAHHAQIALQCPPAEPLRGYGIEPVVEVLGQRIGTGLLSHPDRLDSAGGRRVLSQPGKHVQHVPIRRKDWVEHLDDASALDDAGEAPVEGLPSQLEGWE